MSLLPPYATHRETAVLCLNPVHAKPFVDFYYAFHEKYESFCKGIGSFSAVSEDKPVIHCTLSVVRITELQDALELVFQMMSSPKPKLPRWRSTPIPCASSNGLT